MSDNLSPLSARNDPALRTPALGRFGPLALSVAALAAISMALMAWSHRSWNDLQSRSHRFDGLLATVQSASQQSQWLATHVQPGALRTDARRAGEPLDKAIQACAELAELSPHDMQPTLRILLNRLQESRLVLTSLLRATGPQPLPGTEARVGTEVIGTAQLQAQLTALDQATHRTAREWAAELARQIGAQRRLDVINMGLVGGVTLLLLTLIGLAHRQRETALRALQARTAQLRALADALPDLAFLLDRQGRYVDIFGSNLALLGRPREQVIGHLVHEFFRPEKSAMFMRVIRETLDSGKTQPLSYPAHVMGGLRHFDSRCAPVGDSDQVVWMIWDVTPRRHAEQRLVHMTRLYDFLSHVNQAIVRSVDDLALMQHVCRAALDHGRFKKAWVVMFDPVDDTRLVCQAEAGEIGPRAGLLSFSLQPLDDLQAPLDTVLREGRIFHTGDLAQVDQRPPWANHALAAGLAGCAIVPLLRDQALVGQLILLDTSLNAQNTDERALLQELSSDLSFALTNLHRESLRDQAEERIRLHAAALESTQDGMMVINRTGMLVSINPAFTHITGYEELEVVGRTPELLLPDNPEETLSDMRANLLELGSWQGEVWCQRKSGELFMTKLSVSAVKSLRGRPTHFVGVFTDITQLKQTEERLAKMAHFDTLTELPNRLMIHQRLSHAVNLALRHHTLVGVVFIDLDNFKTVNDGLGHAAGDNLLKQVADRLRLRVRQEDTLGRLGGDEFILVLEHLRHPQQAAHVAQSILETLNQPFTLDGGQQIYVRASIGISLYPTDSHDAAELIRDADAAMYESKRRGRNSFSFYTEAFTSDATSRLQLETRLRRAVEHGEFALHYQPMVRLSDRQIVAVEALVRLKAPLEADACLPSINPDEFIPVMEDTGMIVALSEWVLLEGCRQGKAWLDAGLDFGRLSINLSPSEIRRGGVVERVSRILNRTGLPPDRLELEITESGLMESGVGAEQFLQMLHALGVSLSIDDFGTGYSSLAYLKRFPVHQLKIDRSFIQDLPGNESDAQLVGTMISMAHGLHLRVVAEGVEIPDQEAFLIQRGCDLVQGYLYSRALPAPMIEQLLSDNIVSKKSTIVR